MHKTKATVRIPIVIALAAILALGFSLMPAGAATSGNAGMILIPAGHGPAHVASVVWGVDLSGISGVHSAAGYSAYVYADDGQAIANTIDEFGATSTGLTHLGTILTGGADPFLYGQTTLNEIAVTNNAAHGPCLIHTDQSSLVESFSINLATGVLTEVSSVPIGGGAFHPGDVKLSPNGNDAYVAAYANGPAGTMLVSFPIGVGCTLGTSVTFTAPGTEYLAISVPDAHQLFAPDTGSSNLDIYSIASDGLTLSLQTSHPDFEIENPEGATSGTVGTHTFVFTGEFGHLAPTKSEARTLNTTSGVLGFTPGSPQNDPNGFGDGANVLFTPGLNLVTQTEFFSTAVAAYGSNSNGTMYAFKSHADLEPSSDNNAPTSQASIANVLLVENVGNDTVNTCQLAASGVSNCVQAATLTSNGSAYTPTGIGVIHA